MIDLDEIEAQSAVLVRTGCGGSCVTTSDDVLELITRLRQAEKDAARYRWLRDKACHSEWHAVGGADPSVWDVIVDEYIEESGDASNN